MKVRQATTLDVDSIHSIEEQVFTHDIYSKGMIESNIQNPTYTTLVVDIDDVVVGFITVSTVLDESELLKIAVSKSKQTRGVGSLLLESVEDMLRCSGTASMFLEVRADNTSAIPFYEKHGYQKISIREKYYGDTDAYIYRKGLVNDT